MSQMVWTYPGGKKVIQKATGIAGNVVTTITVPAGKRWKLMNIQVELTTDATVVNRYVTVGTQDAANTLKFRVQGSAQVASDVENRFFSAYFAGQNLVLNGLGFQIMEATEDVTIEISAGVAGDSYDYLVEYLEIDLE